MSDILKKRNFIFGLSAIAIILFHIYERVELPLYIPILTNVLLVGNVGVDVFLFFSGVCLSKSAITRDYQKMGWKEYYRNRILRLLIPYLIVTVPFCLWKAVVEYRYESVIRRFLRFFWYISSASFWIRDDRTFWFVYAIAMFYILFRVLFPVLNDNHGNVKIVVATILLSYAVSIFSYYFPFVRRTTIAWSRIPIFVVGIIVGQYIDEIDEWKRKVKHRKLYVYMALLVASCIVIVASISKLGIICVPSLYVRLLYGSMVIALVLVIMLLGLFSNVTDQNHVNKIGELSLELYLVQMVLLYLLKYYGMFESLKYATYVVVPVTTYALAWLIEKLDSSIQKSFKWRTS